MNPSLTTLLATCSAITALGCASLPAEAGRLADISVVLQRTGERLPVYEHQGQRWIEGRPGERYAVEIRNRSGGRVLTVLSVDGVNAITGQTAATQQSGYVLSPRERAAIAGWRKSDQDVAAFYFTALPDSYAARTGRPDDVGVIGLAVFREKASPPPAVFGALTSRADKAGAPAPAAPAAEATASSRSALADAGTGPAKRMEQKLGTGHGERIDAPIEVTQFERATGSPAEVITLRYESRNKLIALGVIPHQQLMPRAFPAGGFVPDPT